MAGDSLSKWRRGGVTRGRNVNLTFSGAQVRWPDGN